MQLGDKLFSQLHLTKATQIATLPLRKAQSQSILDTIYNIVWV